MLEQRPPETETRMAWPVPIGAVSLGGPLTPVPVPIYNHYKIALKKRIDATLSELSPAFPHYYTEPVDRAFASSVPTIKVNFPRTEFRAIIHATTPQFPYTPNLIQLSTIATCWTVQY